MMQKNHQPFLVIGQLILSIAGTGSLLSAQSAVPKQNIVVIMTDQQSADAMSNRIGTQYLKTPAMDYLANHGITFTRAYCANPLCIPSRASMFTGHYTHSVGIQMNDNEKKLDPVRFVNMGSIFQKAGFATGYVGKWHLPYDLKDQQSHGFEFLAHNKNVGMDSVIAGDAIQFLSRKQTKPFLLVASFCNPHNICEWARGQNLPDGHIGDAPAAEFCPPLLPNHAPSRDESDIVSLLRSAAHASPMFPVGNFDEEKWRQYRWAYYRMIEKVDHQIGKILDELKKSGLDKQTVIVFLSDHGDSQGAHRLNQKTNFFEEVVNVPFVIAVPGMKKPVKSEKLIQTGIDLIPTICDYAGIPIPLDLPGVSAKKIVADHQGEPSRAFVVSEVKPVQGASVNGVKPDPDGRMVRGTRYKYWIYNQGKQRESLFDMKNDPGEMVNLATDPKFQSILAEHRKMLADWCLRNRDDFAQFLVN
jgi:arylsulfatase A-like enzyme